jgi:leucyl aminopeptidase (aminopeptidase T)
MSNSALKESARIAVVDVLKLKKEEQVLIITNPGAEAEIIARELYNAALDCSAFPVLVFQPVKTQFDFAEQAVITAFESRPQVVISISKERLGKDKRGIATPYKSGKEEYDHIFHFLLYGEKSCRSFWSPGTSMESFSRTVPIDYVSLGRRCDAVSSILSEAESVHITAPGGTDINVGLRGRTAKSDDGDFSLPGKGGNLPAGESFISPEKGTACGVIVFDGSISLYNKDSIINDPIHCQVKDGFITEINGNNEAKALSETINRAEHDALDYEKDGRIPKGQGAEYAKNARSIGELGIGLNPAARITGAMLEDEKAFRTCHFAVGHNYDNDTPALIHLDGLVKEPTITAYMPDGSAVVIEKEGELQI